MCITLPAFAHAGESVVKWQDFKDYRDVRASSQGKASYHKQIATQFEKHFSKLAEQLPKGYKLNLEITDIDLAGDVRYGGMDEIRVVKPIYFPRIKLNYSLSDNKGSVVSEEDDVELDKDQLNNILMEDSDEDPEDILEHHAGADKALAKLIKMKQEARKAIRIDF